MGPWLACLLAGWLVGPCMHPQTPYREKKTQVECHAMAQCIESCPAFDRGYCHVQTTLEESVVVNPCPAVYMCEFCLSVVSSSPLASDHLECFGHLYQAVREL